LALNMDSLPILYIPAVKYARTSAKRALTQVTWELPAVIPVE
jgi:hypothetical protein